jgi:hypothetical protein
MATKVFCFNAFLLDNEYTLALKTEESKAGLQKINDLLTEAK